ncbi:MAG: dihydrofolate reductase family protein [Vicinamibacterales bacterium]
MLAASRAAERAMVANLPLTYAMSRDGELVVTDDTDPPGGRRRQPGSGWELRVAAGDHGANSSTCISRLRAPRHGVRSPSVTSGQSIDGFIAAVGPVAVRDGRREHPPPAPHARAVRCRRCRRRHGCCRRPAADDEARARAKSAARVVLDPSRRLGDHYKVFTDDSADTLYVCATSALADGERHVGQAPIETVADAPNGMDLSAVLELLRRRGCHRIFVEGGGVTVSMFLGRPHRSSAGGDCPAHHR